tara:strand:- start:510 stop:767 length:258 start_codon:yes stop_codon:yes gene_type:complete
VARWSTGLPIVGSSQLVALASAALADVKHRLTSVKVNVNLPALARGYAILVTVASADCNALRWMNVLTHGVLLSGYTYIISTRKE